MKCVHVLLKIARDKAFERLIKVQKGKSSYRISVIKKRHAASLEMALDLIVPCGYNEWKVISSTDDSHTYQVKKESECSTNCLLRCSDCNICVHEFTCTCPDSVIHATICKHIHLLRRKFPRISPSLGTSLQDNYTKDMILKRLLAHFRNILSNMYVKI